MEFNGMIGKKVCHLAPVCKFVDGKFIWPIDKRIVKLKAISGKWAMINRPHALPYCCTLDELDYLENHPEAK